MTATKNPMNSGEEKKEGISIESQKVLQGMSLVFTGALTMLEAIHPSVSIEPRALLHLLTGNADRLYAFAEEKSAATANPSADETDKAATGTEADCVVDAAPATEPDGHMRDAPAGASESPLADSKQENKVPATTLTLDDITKIIVQKIKQNRANNEKIGQILRSYGVSKVSELPAAKYEAFVTDLSAI